MLQSGLLLDRKYRLDRAIGHGGMGTVWRAERVGWNAPVAVKLIHLELLSAHPNRAEQASRRAVLLQRFFSEARTAASIRSPHVVQVLDHGVDATLGLPFIVMELLDGETLEQRLTRESSLLPQMTAELISQIARALSRLHESNMVHRDLKPSNVFLVANEDSVLVKLLDFGITKSITEQVGATPITFTGEPMGTPYYMSPEQIRGLKPVTPSSDIWALGVLAFECLTGQRPFDGDTLGDLSLKICAEAQPIPSGFAPVPAGFDAWFARATERDVTRRFQSAREAADAFRELASAERMEPRRAASTVTRMGSAETVMAVNTSLSVNRKARKRWPIFAGAFVGLAIASFSLLWKLKPVSVAPHEHPPLTAQPRAESPRSTPESSPALPASVDQSSELATDAPLSGAPLTTATSAAQPVKAVAPLRRSKQAASAPPPNGSVQWSPERLIDDRL